MPLIELDSATAIDTLKSNGASMWPKRGEANRLSPIAKPRLQPKFQLLEGETIFTIGSCFARNVERELAARGFALPAHQAVKADPDFMKFGTGVLNNYGTPSIYNEIHWALEREFRDEECFLQVGSKWIDMHLPNTLRPADLETCRARRAVITEVYRQIPKCRIVIITLGLSEVWLDTKTGVYLNAPPRRGMLREEPDRFKLHVLSFDEAMGFMRRSMEMIAKHGCADVRVLMTVSPVPLSATLRDMDVMEANTYSKAVLRVVAEHIRSEFDFVDYYPSFESVTLSDRSLAWQDDEVHVTPEIVAVNIGRMVNAYTGVTDLSLEELRDKIQTERPPTVLRLIADHEQFLEHKDIATSYVNAAVRCGDFAAAESWLHNAEDPKGFYEASIAFHKGEYSRALQCLKPGVRRPVAWHRLKLRSHIALGEMGQAEQSMREWVAASPNSFDAYSIMAAATPDIEKAAPYYEQAIELSGNFPRACVEFAERLVAEGQVERAKAVIDGVTPDTSPIRSRIEKIKAAL